MSDSNPTTKERLATLEEQIRALRAELRQFAINNREDHVQIFTRLDVLNGWRHESSGALGLVGRMIPWSIALLAVGASLYVGLAG